MVLERLVLLLKRKVVNAVVSIYIPPLKFGENGECQKISCVLFNIHPPIISTRNNKERETFFNYFFLK